MSELEKYFMENREKFDSQEPAPGHSVRFSKRLRSEKGRNKRRDLRFGLQIAASIAIILASAVVIVKSSKGSKKMAMTPQVEEFMEARDYFTHQVNQRYDELSGFSFTSEEEKEMLMEELVAMDVLYKELLRELDANPGDERVMNTLIQHYQVKMRVMDQIIEQLIDVKNHKTSNDEKSTI